MASMITPQDHEPVEIEDRVSFTPAQRRAVLAAYEGRCAMCGAVLTPDTCEIDHILARWMGGKHEASNWRPLCVSPCHADKSRMDTKARFKVKRLIRTLSGEKPKTHRGIRSAGFPRDPLRNPK